MRTRPPTASFHHALSPSPVIFPRAQGPFGFSHTNRSTAAAAPLRFSLYTFASLYRSATLLILCHDHPPLRRRPRPVFRLIMDSRPPRPLIHNPNHQSSSSSSSSSSSQPTVYQPPSSQQPPVQIPFSDPFSQRRGPDPFMPNAQSQRRGSYGREHGDRTPLAAGWPPTSGT